MTDCENEGCARENCLFKDDPLMKLEELDAEDRQECLVAARRKAYTHGVCCDHALYWLYHSVKYDFFLETASAFFKMAEDEDASDAIYELLCLVSKEVRRQHFQEWEKACSQAGLIQ